jgi:predicted amidohydrolase
MISSPSVDDNLATARRLVAQAAAGGAELVLLPEYWAIMGRHETDKLAHAEQLAAAPSRIHGADGAPARHLADRRHLAAGLGRGRQGPQHHAGV